MLRVRDLTVRFGDVLAVEQLSFDVGEGQIVGLVGSNGAGKTTTLSAISALVKNRSGSIELDGKDISRLPPHKIVERGLIHARSRLTDLTPTGARSLTLADLELVMERACHQQHGAQRDRACARKQPARPPTEQPHPYPPASPKKLD